MKSNRKQTVWLILGLLLLTLPACIGLESAQPADAPLLEATLPANNSPAATSVPAGSQPDRIGRDPLEEQAAALLPSEQQGLEDLSDIPYYDLSLEIEYAARSFSGSSRVHYTNRTGQPLDLLYFHLLPNGGQSYGRGSLEVLSTSVDDAPVEAVAVEGGRLWQTPLPAQLEPGEQVVIQLDFTGQVPERFAGGGYGLFNYDQGVLVMTGWYPLLAVYDQRGWNLNPPSNIGDSVYAEASFYTVQVEASQELVLAATGSELERRLASSSLIYRFASGPVREFALVLAPNFLVESAETGGTRINSYYLPGGQTAAQEALTVALQSLETFNRLFGTYPYAELDLVETPLRYAAGVEFPGIVFLHRSAYTGGPAPYLADLVAHEVAHQWWYNVIGNDVFEHPWLDEALATYSSALYLESVEGEAAYQRLMDETQAGYERLVRARRDEAVTSSLAYFESGGRSDRYGAVVYSKGSLFFHILRLEMGDASFFAALQEYYETFKYRIAFPEDLLRLFEAHHDAPLQDLFQEWLYSSQ